MGTKNEEAVTRSAKAKTEPNNISRGRGAAGGEGENAGSEQERDTRTRSARSNFFAGTGITGKMIDHLISEYRDQVVIKEKEFQSVGNEIKRLESRIKEFESLRDALDKESEDNL